ncbi:MAG TPA: co-chaperone GroES [Thermodesulfobacteriota bacterium]|jgi:chaperonin GroES|nr:co-chaperone GroES [Patescibacteria group bacterium]HLE25023.1 co-chaperone GroES [Thermodesulfobacteriota bacterium]
MNVRPLHDKILIKRIDAPQMTKGGIVIPDTVKEKPQEGKVVATGKGRILEDGKVVPLVVKRGDRILFGKYGGTEIKIEGEDYIILDENEVLAIIEE